MTRTSNSCRWRGASSRDRAAGGRARRRNRCRALYRSRRSASRASSSPNPGFASTRSQSGWLRRGPRRGACWLALTPPHERTCDRPVPSRRRPRPGRVPVGGRARALGLSGDARERCRSRTCAGTRSDGDPGRRNLLAGVLAVAVVALALTFTASLHHLFSTPWLYGQNWDYRSNYAVPSAAINPGRPADQRLRARRVQGPHTAERPTVGVVAMDDVKGRIDAGRHRGVKRPSVPTRSCSRKRRSTRSASRSETWCRSEFDGPSGCESSAEASCRKPASTSSGRAPH